MKKSPPQKNRRKNMPASKRGLRYPIAFVAGELGVDTQTLLRRCEQSGFPVNGTGIKFSEAHDAWCQKSISEAARRRKTLAEAEASEIDTLKKKGLFVYRVDHANTIKDLAVQTRVIIERAKYLPKELRAKLIKELAEIKPSIAESSRD